MIKVFGVIKKMISNQAFLFIGGKYFAYALQFINAVLLAQYLGPFLYGIYGFIFLVIRYIKYINPGAHFAVNVVLATHQRDNIDEANKVASNGLLISLVTGILAILIVIFIKVFSINVFEKYQFDKYIFITVLIGTLNNINVFFTNVYRSYSKFIHIVAYLILPQFLVITAIFIFRNAQNKVDFIRYAYLLGNAISLIYFLICYPLKFNFNFNWSIIKNLLNRGFNLNLYNASIYFILIIAKTIVSIYFNVKELGIYSFANTVAQSSILILGVVSFVFFPKLLNRLKPDTKEIATIKKINEFRKLYLSASFFLVFTVIIFYNFVLLLLKDYQSSNHTFLFIILMQLMLSLQFGYSHLLISRGKENIIARYAFITMIFSAILSLVGIIKFDCGLSWVAFSTFIATLFYSMFVVREGKKHLNCFDGYFSTFKDLFPINYLIPTLVLLLERLLIGNIYSVFVPLIVLILFNYSLLISTLKKFVTLMKNPNSTKF